MDHLVLCLVSDSGQARESHSDAACHQSADSAAGFSLNEGVERVVGMAGSTETHRITALPPVPALIPVFASLLNAYLLSSYYMLGILGIQW